MRSWLCIFMQHKWMWVVDFMHRYGEVGLYQCQRCRTISIGATRPSKPNDFEAAER
jgi:hypothetical protein